MAGWPSERDAKRIQEIVGPMDCRLVLESDHARCWHLLEFTPSAAKGGSWSWIPDKAREWLQEGRNERKRRAVLNALHEVDLWPIPVSRGLSDDSMVAVRATDKLLKIMWDPKRGRFRQPL